MNLCHVLDLINVFHYYSFQNKLAYTQFKEMNRMHIRDQIIFTLFLKAVNIKLRLILRNQNLFKVEKKFSVQEEQYF